MKILGLKVKLVPMNGQEEQYRQLWARQLQNEHSAISWSYGVRLNKVVIEIVDSKTVWGSWHKGQRTIRIAAALIKQHPWDVVINVFKHEMSHQLVDEIIGGKAGHGRDFQEAAKALGVPASFCQSGGDLPANILAAESCLENSSTRQMLQRIRKLLALAESSNVNEAQAAMQKANYLLEQYNLSQLDIDDSAAYISLIINLQRQRIENYQRLICTILMDFFFVDVVSSRLYDAETDQTYKTFELLGRQENVKMAEYVYYFLQNRLLELWERHARKKGLPAAQKRSYWLGVLEGFREKLQDSAAQRKAQTKQMVRGTQLTISASLCRSDARLLALKRQRFPKLAKSRRSTVKFFKDAYGAGTTAGREIIIHKGLETKGCNNGKLLGEIIYGRT